MNNRYVTVLRNGQFEKIFSTELVAGDIVKASLGDFVEADLRWIETNELQVIESHLTGEADAISKHTEV
ncbi:P-type ATPase, partial [Streptococcus agalactiae]